MSVVKCEVCVLVWGRGGPGFRVCVISAGVLLMAGQDRLWRKPGSSFVWESLLLHSLPLSLSLSLRSVHPLGISSSSLTVRVGFSTLYSLTFFLSLFPSLFLGIWSRFTFLVGSFSDSHLSCAIEGSSECLESFDLFSWGFIFHICENWCVKVVRSHCSWALDCFMTDRKQSFICWTGVAEEDISGLLNLKLMLITDWCPVM